VKVLLADSDRLTLQGILRALEGVDDINVVGEARSGGEMLRLVERVRPDMVLMDAHLPDIDGLECLDLMRRRHRDVKVVLLSASDGRERIQEALDRGATAYIVKSVNPTDLPSALRQAFEGTVFSGFGRVKSEATAGSPAEGVLTERELAILRAVASGLSNKAIGRELWVTEQTVKFHLTNIYRKLGVANRTAAAQYAHANGLLGASPGSEPARAGQIRGGEAGFRTARPSMLDRVLPAR